MGSIWLLGFVAFILYRVFYAGMNSSTLFYYSKKHYRGGEFSVDNVMGYVFATLGFALTWPLTLPLTGIYLLGKRFQKEVK